MKIFKISFFIKNPSLTWDYKKVNNSNIWDDISNSVVSKLKLDDYFLCKKGSFQYIFYFKSEFDICKLKELIGNVSAEIVSLVTNFSTKDILTTISETDVSELANIKDTAESFGNTESLLSGSAECTSAMVDVSKPSLPETPKQSSVSAPAGNASSAEKTASPTSDANVEVRTEMLEIGKKIAEFKAFKDFLIDNVKGQRHAIDEVVEGIFETEVFSLYNAKRKGPVATFLFAGPSGVGKTHIAHMCEEYLGRKTLVVDMSEYSSNIANCMFNGEHGSPAIVTSFVRNNPDGILVFDEIEKAHINTIHLFLQILDEAKLMDYRLNKEVSFKNNIIIMTTNAGKQLYSDTTVCDLSRTPKNVILDGLRKDVNPQTMEPYFPECITTRMANGRVILFNHLEPFSLHSIVKKVIETQLSLFKKSTGIEVECDIDVLAALILYCGGGVSDARSLTGLAKGIIVKELQEMIIQLYNNSPEAVNTVKKIQISVDTSDENVGNLFENKEKSYAVILSDIDENSIKESFEKINTDVEVITDVDKFQKRIRGVADYVLVDPRFMVSQMYATPNDIEDFDSVGMSMFDYMLSDFPEIPVYVLNTRPEENVRYDTLLGRGAKGVITYTLSDKHSFEEEIRKLAFESSMNTSVYSLGRSGKILTYNCAQYVIDSETAVISFEKLQLKSALMSGDGTMVAQKGDNNNIMFSDVVGCKDAKETLMEFKKALDNPRTIAASGKKMPKGVLLYGPPGTGKTLLAKAMANECKATFFPVSATSFLGSYVGETEKNIRTLFEKARKYAPSIIFIDEIDAIARRRTGGSTTVHYETALNELLTQMDGFKTDNKRPVFVFAATNYELEGDGPRVLDSAFVRRFDSKILIPLPDTDERYEFLVKSLERHGIHFGEDHEKILRNMAERTAGMSNADLEMMNSQFIRELGDNEPDRTVYLDTLDSYRFGSIKEMDDSDVIQTACHEAGHALICRLCGETPTFLTIVSRGNYGGFMEAAGEKSGSYTYEDLTNRICRSLAGRVAEIEMFGESKGMNTGASSDIQHARYYVKKILEDFAMGKRLYEGEITEEAEELIQTQFARTKQMVHEHRDVLERLAKELFKRKSLDKAQLEEFFVGENI